MSEHTGRRRGRPVVGAVAGFFLGLFLGLDLLLLGVVRLDNAVLTVAPVVGLVLGLVLGLTAPFGRRGGAAPEPATRTGTDEERPATPATPAAAAPADPADPADAPGEAGGERTAPSAEETTGPS